MTALEMRNRIKELEQEVQDLRSTPMAASQDNDQLEALRRDYQRLRNWELSEDELEEMWQALDDVQKKRVMDLAKEWQGE